MILLHIIGRIYLIYLPSKPFHQVHHHLTKHILQHHFDKYTRSRTSFTYCSSIWLDVFTITHTSSGKILCSTHWNVAGSWSLRPLQTKVYSTLSVRHSKASCFISYLNIYAEVFLHFYQLSIYLTPHAQSCTTVEVFFHISNLTSDKIRHIWLHSKYSAILLTHFTMFQWWTVFIPCNYSTFYVFNIRKG